MVSYNLEASFGCRVCGGGRLKGEALSRYLKLYICLKHSETHSSKIPVPPFSSSPDENPPTDPTPKKTVRIGENTGKIGENLKEKIESIKNQFVPKIN